MVHEECVWILEKTFITCIFTFVFTAYCLHRYTTVKPGLNSNVLETLPLYLFLILKITPAVLRIFPPKNWVVVSGLGMCVCILLPRELFWSMCFFAGVWIRLKSLLFVF